jgi:hypothetical protein
MEEQALILRKFVREILDQSGNPVGFTVHPCRQFWVEFEFPKVVQLGPPQDTRRPSRSEQQWASA